MFASNFFKCEVLKPLSIKSTAIIQSRGLNLSSLAKYNIYPRVCVLVCVHVCVVSQFKDHDYIDFKRGHLRFITTYKNDSPSTRTLRLTGTQRQVNQHQLH